MYIVRYSTGSYDDYATFNIFVTNKKTNATEYVTKFNNLLEKWKQIYSKYEEDRCNMPWIKEEFYDKKANRWHILTEINKCWYEEIKER